MRRFANSFLNSNATGRVFVFFCIERERFAFRVFVFICTRKYLIYLKTKCVVQNVLFEVSIFQVKYNDFRALQYTVILLVLFTFFFLKVVFNESNLKTWIAKLRMFKRGNNRILGAAKIGLTADTAIVFSRYNNNATPYSTSVERTAFAG